MKESEFAQLIRTQLAGEPFSVDGVLQKWVVIGKAQNGDSELIKRLLTSADLKKAFFKEVAADAADVALVFDQQKFVRYLEMKNYLKDSYTEYTNKIGLRSNEQYLKPSGEVVLAWPYKDCVLKGGQMRESDRRNEVFFNQTLARDEITQLLAPKVLTAAVRHTVKGKQTKVQLNRDAELNQKRGLPADTITDNLLIKGNNLLALHSLKSQFAGKVKLIYIDPPYNTGGEANIFTYNNSFNHSTWLTFMKNRLEVAREFLREDGFIAIAIDHAELFYLGVLADEVFGRDNQLGVVSVKHHPAGRTNDDFFAATNEYMVVYARDKSVARFNKLEMSEKTEKSYKLLDEISKYKLTNSMRTGETRNATRQARPKQFYPIYVSKNLTQVSIKEEKGYIKILPVANGIEWVWSFAPSTLQKMIDSDEVVVRENADGAATRYSVFYKNRITHYPGRKPSTTWDDKIYNASEHGTKLVKQLLGRNGFSYPKSIHTLLDALKIMTNTDDIVLDFFAGSGTTGHAALELNKQDGGNRQFILVEQLDTHITVCVERLQKIISGAADGEFVAVELKQHNQKFVDAIQTATTVRMLSTIWQKMKKEAFLDYNLDMEKQEANLADFKALSLEQQKKSLLKTLDKNQRYVNLSSLKDADRHCNAEEKRITADFYGLKK